MTRFILDAMMRPLERVTIFQNNQHLRDDSASRPLSYPANHSPTYIYSYASLILNPLLKLVSTALPSFFLEHHSTHPSTNKFAPFTKLILGLVMSTATSPTSSNFALLPCRASSAFQASIGTPPSVPTIGVRRLVSRKPGEIAFTRM